MTTDRKAYWREYAAKNREKRKAISAAYRQRNKPKIAAYARKYRETHDTPERTASKPRVTKPKPAPTDTDTKAALRAKFLAYRQKQNVT